MKHSDTQLVSANSVQAGPISIGWAGAAPLSNSRWELFAQHVAAGFSQSESYAAAGYRDLSPAVLGVNACRLAATPAVQARIRALRGAAAERAEISIASRMAWLNDVVHADAAELSQVVRCICPHCWPDEMAYARAVQAYLDALDAATPLPPPDTAAPRHDCPHGPHQRVELVPTAELSGAARAAFRGARQKSDGSIEVLMEDRAQCVDLLNKMQGVYVTKTESKNLNINATVDAADLTPAALLARFKSVNP